MADYMASLYEEYDFAVANKGDFIAMSARCRQEKKKKLVSRGATSASVPAPIEPRLR